MTHDSGTAEGGDDADRFVALLEWLIRLDGDLRGITKVISTDTLRKWRDGKYPKQRSTGAVAALDRWARDTYPGVYPPPWESGGLIALAGPARTSTAPSTIAPVPGDERNTHSTLPTGKRPRLAVLAGLAVITLLAALIAIALLISTRHGPGSSSTLYVRGGGPVAIRKCPALSCSAFNLPTGTKVTMICFRDAQDVNLNYSSPRWFDVRDSSGTTGWVHSSEVSNQIRVGLC